MHCQLRSLAIPAITLGALALFAAELPRTQDDFTVHEWGTFTSVAARDGDSIAWRTLVAPPDVPCFVIKGPLAKTGANGFIRMETPVLYFYTQTPMTASVHVDFPHGWMSEWYPAAEPLKDSAWGNTNPSSAAKPAAKPANMPPEVWASVNIGRPLTTSLSWEAIGIWPSKHPALPVENAPSHYYAARETDAAPLRVGDQWEKMLFYRGIGDFHAPLRVRRTESGSLALSFAGSGAIPLAIVFDNRAGKIGYRVLRDIAAEIETPMPDRSANLATLYTEIERDLTAAGLYPKEAHAMVETWRDSWFEEGTRVFYLVPRRIVDAELPLSITPSPDRIDRVFVGRVEVLSNWIEEDIRARIASRDPAGLMRYGRFLSAFLDEMGPSISRSTVSMNLQNEALHDLYNAPRERACPEPAQQLNR